MTKRDVLRAICELPGWQPPNDCASIDRYLEELSQEGWIVPRLDGWEATPEAVNAYPHFIEADGRVIAGDFNSPLSTAQRTPDAEAVLIARVECTVRAMLEELPLTSVLKMLYAQPTSFPPREDDIGWKIAEDLVTQWRR